MDQEQGALKLMFLVMEDYNLHGIEKLTFLLTLVHGLVLLQASI